MSKFVDNIIVLKTNVFALTPILVSFYKNLRSQEKDVLLSYFVFPIVLNSTCLEKLKNLKVTSRLSKITNDMDLMAGFEERFDFYKDITNKCVQYAIECNYIKLNDDLSVSVITDDVIITDTIFSNSITLASTLHKVFTNDVINTYYQFGIKKI
jgi:hypothetical protein